MRDAPMPNHRRAPSRRMTTRENLIICIAVLAIILSNLHGRSYNNTANVNLFIDKRQVGIEHDTKKLSRDPAVVEGVCRPEYTDKYTGKKFKIGQLYHDSSIEMLAPGARWQDNPEKYERYFEAMWNMAAMCNQGGRRGSERKLMDAKQNGKASQEILDALEITKMYFHCAAWYQMYGVEYAYWFMQRLASVAPSDVSDFDEETMGAFQASMRMMHNIFILGDATDTKGRLFNWNPGKKDVISRCIDEAASGKPTQTCHPRQFLKDFRMHDWQLEDYVDLEFGRKFEADPTIMRASYSDFVDKTQVSLQFATPMARLDVVKGGFMSTEELESLNAQVRTCFSAFKGYLAADAGWDEEVMKHPVDGKSKRNYIKDLFIELQRDIMPHCANRTAPCYIMGQKEISNDCQKCDIPELKPCLDLYSSSEFVKFKGVQRDAARGFAASSERAKGRAPLQDWDEMDVTCNGWSVVYEASDVGTVWHEHDMTGFGAGSVTGMSAVFYIDVAPGSQIHYSDPRGSTPWLSARGDLFPKLIRPEFLEPHAMPVYAGSIHMWPSYIWHGVPSRKTGQQVVEVAGGADDVPADDDDLLFDGKSRVVMPFNCHVLDHIGESPWV